MANQKRGLGKNLQELLSASLSTDNDDDVAVLEEIKTAKTPKPTEIVEKIQETKPLSETNNNLQGGNLKYLSIQNIARSSYQPRHDIDPDTLEELANSIRAQGILQPIVVRKIDTGYELVAGERRWRAAQLAGLHEIPAIIKDLSNEAALAVALIENIQRENLNPLDQARALQRLADEFELTHLEVSDAVGKSRTTVTNLLRLLSLNQEVLTLLENGDIEMGHARALLAVAGKQQNEIARTIVSKGLSVRETEHLIRRQKQTNTKKQDKKAPLDPNIIKLQADLSQKLGAKVAIKSNAKGKGQLLIHYNDFDELDGILAHIN